MCFQKNYLKRDYLGWNSLEILLSQGYVFDQNFLSQGYPIEHRSCSPCQNFSEYLPNHHNSIISSNTPLWSHQLLVCMFLRKGIFYNNIGPNGHLFYVGGNLMMRRGTLPIIMLPDRDLHIALHLVPFWILRILGECSHWGNRGTVA